MAETKMQDGHNPVYSWRFASDILIRGTILFLMFNLFYIYLLPGETLGSLSFYNMIFPGRERLPFGENPQQAYNLSLYNLDAMFASHILADSPKPRSEYRVIVLGDSSVWGILLKPQETLSGILNLMDNTTKDNKEVRLYNLGYPTLSLTKDLLILDQAMTYDPDMILWLVTLESFPEDKQLSSPLVTNNAKRIAELIAQYQLPLSISEVGEDKNNLWNNTLLGDRRMLADLIRLQLYGILWSSTGIDQVYPSVYEPAQRDFEKDISFHDWDPPIVREDQLRFDYLRAAEAMTGDVPIILVNGPILISSGQNNELRYDYYYPKWAYDQYRALVKTYTEVNGWDYLDTWDLIDENEFTNSAIHLSPEGSRRLAEMIHQKIVNVINQP